MATKFPTKRLSSSFNLETLPLSKEIDKDTTLQYWRNPSVLPTIMALLNKIQLIRDSEGLISTTATLTALRAAVEGREFEFASGKPVEPNEMKTIFDFLAYPARGEMFIQIKNQLEPQSIRWAGNVPLFISAFKEYRNVKYSEWDLSDPKLSLVTDRLNLEVFGYIGLEHQWSKEDLIDISRAMRTGKSGKAAGVISNPNTYITNKTGTYFEFDGLPKYVKQLLCQTWAYQPGLGNKYAILDLNNIDAETVEPLIATADTLFDKPVETKKVRDLDW